MMNNTSVTTVDIDQVARDAVLALHGSEKQVSEIVETLLAIVSPGTMSDARHDCLHDLASNIRMFHHLGLNDSFESQISSMGAEIRALI